MAKDKDENQHSFGNKAAAALTTMVGAAAFHRLGGTKLIAKGVPKVNKFISKVADDLSDMALKDYDAKNISKLYKKHISEENSTLRKILKENDNKMKLNTSGDSAVAAFMKLKEVQANSNTMMKKLFNTEYSDTISKQLSEKYNIKNKEFKSQIDKLTKEALTKNNLIEYVDGDEIKVNEKVISSFLDFEKFNLGENKNNFFNDLVNAVQNSELEYKKYKDKHTDNEGNIDFIKNITNELTGKKFAETYGTNENLSLRDKLKGKISDERGFTFGDYLDNIDKFDDQIVTLGNGEQISLKDEIKKFAEENEEIKQVLLDAKNLRVNSKNETIDYSDINEMKNNFMRSLAGTLPGKILKITDVLSAQEPGAINFFEKDKAAPLLGKGGTADKNYIHLLNNLYEIDNKNNLKEVSGSSDFYYMSSKHGTAPRILNEMFGLNSEKKPNSRLAKKFDIGTTTESTILDDFAKEDGFIGNIARSVTKGKRYNIIDRMKDENLAINDAVGYRKNLKKVDSVFSHIAKTPNIKTISKMQNVVERDISKDILEALQCDNVDDMVESLVKHKDLFINKDLKQLVTAGTKDRERVAKLLSIKNDKITDSKDVLKYVDMLRREGFKEVLFTESINQYTEIKDVDKVFSKMRRAGLQGAEYNNTKLLTHWAEFQNAGDLFNASRNEKGLTKIKASNEKVLDMLLKQRIEDTSLNRNDEFIKDFRTTIDKIQHNFSELTNRTEHEDRAKNIIRGIENNESIIMRKAYNPGQFAKDIISNLNDTEKIKADSKRFLMQFVAGKNSPEYVTTYTTIPYFFTSRLTEPFKKFGLGLSSENMGSVTDQWKAIMTKRVIPTAAGLTAFSYFNDEVKNFTGTSLTGAMAQGVANIDLGLRKLADVTGIGSLLDAERNLNPISQYWFGEDYQDSNERKDYYVNGYDEVRKGRWWGFGSANEFRGGKISYYQPNFVKRANSDWYDESLYGGTDEKWKHSWIPTPRHPFAPIRRALDPYWLERKHYYDRPYMETAPLFSTGTPWGAVLNPTIGEIIKPVRRMHQDETRRGLTDPRTLIAERNERLKAKAVDKNKENLFTVSNKGITNVSYTPKALADPSKAVVTYSVSNGRINSVDFNGVGYQENVTPISEVDATSAGSGVVSYSSNKNGSYVGGSTPHSNGLMVALESTEIGSYISNQFNSILDTKSIISDSNRTIIQKAASKSDGVTVEKVNLATMPFKEATERLATKQDEADLLLTTSKHDFLTDALFSGKQLSGIYGFLGDILSGDKGRKVRLENADKMGSFKTKFWDANIGGLGGGVMEIARRFFPHDDHSWTEINPIRNTMPEWMPEKFKVGDPFRKVTKGEMRLPGRGYESIHKLRPDEYGKYGALDRMRILADVAPYSDEYKTWREIASDTVTDAAGKKEIEEIKKRVEKQSKNHEFYNYKFLHNPSEINTEIIKEVDNSTITTMSGKTIAMAGVKLTKNADISNYLVSGMKVQVETLKKDSESDTKAGAIYVNGENINKALVDSGEAHGDKTTAMGAKALTGQIGQLYGEAMELIGHAQIPWIHNKLMKIDTPLEAYKNERVYGTPYSTWNHPIKGFIMPAFQKSWARGPVGQGIAVGAWALAENVWKNTDQVTNALKYIGIDASETAVNRLASTVFNIANPGAFAGSMMASIPTGLMGSEGIKGLLNTAVFQGAAKEGAGRLGARLGATIMLAGYGITRTDKPIESTAIFATAGIALSKQLNHEKFGARQGAILGAGLGLALSALRNPRFDKEKMFGIYTPESTKKRWDIDEYYDRLEYIKYQGLYEKAARKAKFWEHTDIKKIIQANEYQKKVNSKKIEKLNNRIEKVSNSNLEDSRKQEILQKLESEKYALSISQSVFRGGKYTKAAIAYKQAADSTIFGLKEDATSQQVLRAIPKGDKDFFMEFSKEKDKKKQKEILKYVSPYQRRALQIAWGYKNIDDVESNEDYFKKHELPGTLWVGWKPRVDMEHVKMKTIENEGMLLSDFGIYESQKNEPAAIMAPEIKQFDKGNTAGMALQARLKGALNGSGLIGVKVSVSPTSANGIEVVANITNSIKITEYKIKQGLNQVMGTRMFY